MVYRQGKCQLQHLYAVVVPVLELVVAVEEVGAVVWKAQARLMPPVWKQWRFPQLPSS